MRAPVVPPRDIFQSCLASTEASRGGSEQKAMLSPPWGFLGYASKWCYWTLMGQRWVHHSQCRALPRFSKYGMSSINYHVEWKNLAKESCWTGRNKIFLHIWEWLGFLRNTQQWHCWSNVLLMTVSQDLFATSRLQMTRGKSVHNIGHWSEFLNCSITVIMGREEASCEHFMMLAMDVKPKHPYDEKLNSL